MAPSRHFSLSRRGWLLLGLALIPIILLIIGEIAGWPFLRGPAERQLTQRMEREVRIDEPFRLRLLGGIHLTAGGLWIAAPDGFDVPHFLDAQDIDLRLRYSDLFRFRKSGLMRIAALDIGRLDARMLRQADGDSTWQFRKRDPNEPPQPLPVVDRLAVGQGGVVFRDPRLQADVEARFDTREGSSNGNPVAHMQAQGKFRGHPVKGELTSEGWLPAATSKDDAKPVAAKGWLEYGGVRGDFDGTVMDILGRRGIKGAVSVRGPSLGLVGHLFDAPLPTTAPFLFEGHIDKSTDTWKVDVDKAEIGKSRLAANFTFDPSPKPPRLVGELRGSNLVLADLAPAFGTLEEEGRRTKPRPGRIFPNRPLDLPTLKKLGADIRVDIDRVDLGKAFREPIHPFKAQLTLDQGQLGLAKVDARTAKGRLSGEISVNAQKEMPQWRTDLAWEGIQLAEWLKSAKAREKNGNNGAAAPPYFTGTLQGRAKLVGSGQSTAELLGSLDGEITMFVKNGTLSHLVAEVVGLDVAQGLGIVVRGDESLPVRCAVVDLQARDGKITPKVALVDTPATMILMDGTVDLMRERLDMRLTARPKNVSPFTVRSPIRVQGTLADPEAGPEPGPIAARVLGGVALAFVNPLAAIIPFIDPGDGAESPCAQALANLKR